MPLPDSDTLSGRPQPNPRRDAGWNVTVVPAEQPDHIAAMLVPYLAELGVPADYPYLNLYWSDDARHAYEFLVGDERAGFALVRQQEGTFEMAEFYVAPEWRRHRIGRSAATSVLAAHPGAWEVHSFPGSAAAERFWETVLTGGERRVEGGRPVFRLHVAPKPRGLGYPCHQIAW